MFERIVICGFAFLVTAGMSAHSAPSWGEVKEKLHAQAVLLKDVETGKILYERRADTPYPPASTVKLMTALLAYERLGLDGTVVIERGDTRVEPSNVPLRAGEKVSVKDLVRSVLIGSDNDSAMALARKVAGSVPKFVAIMNLRAKQLGCKNTVFANPHGLPSEDKQQTTVSDLMIIFEKVISIPELREIASTKSFRLRTRVGSQIVKNHNKLLGKYPGMGAAKTGWTYASRHTYAALACQKGRELRLTLLKSYNKWEDARLLFDYGFSHLPKIPDKPKPQPKPAKKEAPKENEKPCPTSQPIIETKQTTKTVSHTVQRGDTLWGLGKRYGCSIEDIMLHNKFLSNPDQIKPGQVLQIPKPPAGK